MGVVARLSLDTSGREMAHRSGTCSGSAGGRLETPQYEQRSSAMGNLARAAAPTPDVGRGGLGPGFHAGSELRILCGPNSGNAKSGEDLGSRSRRRRGGRGMPSCRSRCTGRARRSRASAGRAGECDVVARGGDAVSARDVPIGGALRGMKVGAAARWAALLIQQAWRSMRQDRSSKTGEERGRDRDRARERGPTMIERQWTGARAQKLGRRRRIPRTQP